MVRKIKYGPLGFVLTAALMASLGAGSSRASFVEYRDPKYTPQYDFKGLEEGMYVFTLPIMFAINWDNPLSAMTSLVRNLEIGPNAVESSATAVSRFGHMMVRYQCRDSRGILREDWGGMSGQNDSSIDKENLLKKKIGLQTLFNAYSDGELESRQHNLHRVAKTHTTRNFFKAMRSNFIRFPLSPSKCDLIHKYFTEYRKRSYDHRIPVREWGKKDPRSILHFGFTVDAYQGFTDFLRGRRDYRLGGGCSSFAVGAIKLIEQFNPIFQRSWGRQLFVPNDLIGDEIQDVSLGKILLGSSGRADWSKDLGSESTPLFLFDPEKVWSFVDRARACLDRAKCDEDVRQWIAQNGDRVSTHSIQASFLAEDEVQSVSPGGYRPKILSKHRVNLMGMSIGE